MNWITGKKQLKSKIDTTHSSNMIIYGKKTKDREKRVPHECDKSIIIKEQYRKH